MFGFLVVVGWVLLWRGGGGEKSRVSFGYFFGGKKDIGGSNRSIFSLLYFCCCYYCDCWIAIYFVLCDKETI